MADTTAVIGATGFVGKNFSRYASEKGSSVLNVARSTDKIPPGSVGIWTAMDIYDTERLAAYLDAHGIDFVYNFIGTSKQFGGDTFEKANANSAKSIAAAARKAGAKRLVHMSGLGVAHIGDHMYPKVQNDYFRSLASAEKAVRESGVKFTTFRPSYIIGKDDLFTLRLRPDIDAEVARVVMDGSARLQPIFIGDACEILYKAPYFAGTDNAAFDLVGPEKISFIKYAQLLSDAVYGRHVELTYKAVRRDEAMELGMSREQIDIRTCDETGDSDWLQKVFDIRLKNPKEFLRILYPHTRMP